MAPSRKKKGSAAAAAEAAAQWKVGDLVLAKMKGFPAWPAMVLLLFALLTFLLFFLVGFEPRRFFFEHLDASLGK